MLERLTNAQLATLTEYQRVMVYLFRKLTAGLTVSTFPDAIPFESSDVRDAAQRAYDDQIVPKIHANLPDIKYTFDARRHMPSEVEQCGPITWLQVKKGYYKLQRTKRVNLLDLSGKYEPKIEHVVDQTPPFITKLLGQDEQAVFTRVRNAGLISQVLGFQSWPIQGHHRTSVSYGQIEIDEVQAGMCGTEGCIVPISGKGGSDQLSWSQALNLNTYGQKRATQKPKKQGKGASSLTSEISDQQNEKLAVRSIGLWRDKVGTVWIVEFTPETDIDQIEIKQVRRFKFV